MRFLFLVVIILTAVHQFESKPTAPVTHEEIRDVILMLVRVVTATEDKLRRHEFRERAIADVIKKALISIDKRTKDLHPVMGRAERLDDRISDVKKTLTENDIKTNNQLKDVKNVLEDILRTFPILIEKMKGDIIKEIKSDISTAVDTLNETSESEEDESDDGEEEEESTSLENKIDKLSSSIKQMQLELTNLKREQQNTLQQNNKFNDYIDRFEVLLTNNENLLKKYEDKFGEGEVLPQDDTQTAWQGSIIQALGRAQNDVEVVLKEVKNTHTKTTDLIRNFEKKLTASLDNTRNYIEQKLDTIGGGDGPILEPIIPDDTNDVTAKLNEINTSIAETNNRLSLINYKEIGETLGRIKSHLNDSQSLFGRYETKLAEYGDKLKLIPSNNECNNNTNIIFQELQKQNNNIEIALNEINTNLNQDVSINSNDDIQNRTLNLLQNLEDSLSENTDTSKNLLEKVKTILGNEEQMLDFNRKSAADIMETMKTLEISYELNFDDVKQELDAIKSKL